MQIKQLNQINQISNHTKAAGSTGQEANNIIQSFKTILGNAINEINELEKRSNILTEKLATGEVEDVHQVMIAAEKARLALQLALEVRNKALNAYKEIMRMQV